MREPREPDRQAIRAWMQQVINKTGWSARHWADKAKTSPTNITRFLDKDDASMPTLRTLAKLAAVTPVSPPRLNGSEAAAESGHMRNEAAREPGTSVSEYDAHASAGGGALIESENIVGEWRFPTQWLRYELGVRRELAIITVLGDSMTGTIEDGDKVIVDLAHRAPSPPGIYIVHDGIAQVAKRLECIEGSEPPRVRIISDNGKYKAYERTLAEINIIGRVRGRWQRL